MEKQVITPTEEKVILNDFFAEVRELLADYCQEREMVLSNSQLYAFLLVSPITIAIATDGTVDFSETTMLVDVAAYFDRDILSSEFDQLEQPEDVLPDDIFKKRVYTELRYLCVSMNRYEEKLIACLKALIKLDERLSQSEDEAEAIKYKIVDTMNSVIYNNLGEDSIEEPKIQKVLDSLEIDMELVKQQTEKENKLMSKAEEEALEKEEAAQVTETKKEEKK
ncbi:hypothetical protein [Microscilla marina]|uniref:Uncharacterized protein n=1 Tax=Microscilla marina ATCC 23134 TaxID=313606 RepID=A1ZGX4_MICM2|nr:hypothetical protein [Microscilla marina]EAY30243.1 hypothetical protein M23134_08065 [Microscilla marina ATCC 23134]